MQFVNVQLVHGRGGAIGNGLGAAVGSGVGAGAGAGTGAGAGAGLGTADAAMEHLHCLMTTVFHDIHLVLHLRHRYNAYSRTIYRLQYKRPQQK